jgi:hypothetical protein
MSRELLKLTDADGDRCPVTGFEYHACICRKCCERVLGKEKVDAMLGSEVEWEKLIIRDDNT